MLPDGQRAYRHTLLMSYLLEYLNDAERGRVTRAMDEYFFDGKEPNFEEGSHEAKCWKMMRSRMSRKRNASQKYARPCAAMLGNQTWKTHAETNAENNEK